MGMIPPEPHVALIVEGDADVRELATALLDETELNVVKVETADAALACLQDHGGEVAMIFADINLPSVMNGAQLAETTCTLWPTVRIVLTSGDSGALPDDLPDCITLMPKPWRGLDVLLQAEKAVHQPQPPVT